MTDLTFAALIALIVVLVLDLMAIAARSGLVSSHLARTFTQNEANNTMKGRLAEIYNSPAYARASLFLALVLLRFALAGLALLAVSPWFTHPNAAAIASGTLLIVALIVAWIEWVVQEQARQRSSWAGKLVAYNQFWTLILYPLIFLTVSTSTHTDGSDDAADTVLENEVKSLVDAGQQEGVFERDERNMIYSIFRLSDTLAREIMVPRIDVTAIDVTTPLAEAVDSLLKSGFSRVPVYDETVDNIKGVLYTKDLLGVWRKGMQASLRELLRPAYFVPEAKKVDQLLAEMQSQRVHMALVVDEYGGIAGLVTLEDIVEEIVGEIQDEFDQTEESPYQEISENEYIFLGRVDIDDFNELMQCSLPPEDADTLGGYIYKRIGRVPAVGEEVQVNNLLLTVEQVSGRRIRKVRARRLPLAVKTDEEKTDAEQRPTSTKHNKPE